MSITDYIEDLLRLCKHHPDKCYLDQAYGAINYHIMTREHDPKEDTALCIKWENEWKSEFEKIIWGV
jgi:hypothetical protein